ALMHVNNRTRWMKEFTVTASVLCERAGLPLSTFKHARAELCKKGYLIHTPRGTKARGYQMVSHVEPVARDWADGAVQAGGEREVREWREEVGLESGEKVDHEVSRDVSGGSAPVVDDGVGCDEDLRARREIDLMIENYRNGGKVADLDLEGNSGLGHEVSRGVSRDVSRDVGREVSEEVSPLYKQDKTKQNLNSNRQVMGNFADSFYREQFGKAPAHVEREMDHWMTVLGDELVFEALKRTVENGKTSWRYTVGILKRWKQDGLKTVEDVLAAEENFRKKRHAGSRDSVGSSFYGGRYRNKREAVVPDWFRKHQEEQK